MVNLYEAEKYKYNNWCVRFCCESYTTNHPDICTTRSPAMNEIARPTDEELDRIEELVDEYFVGEWWALDAKFWDDGDVHLTAYSTLGTSYDDGYPMEVINHRQVIVYEREARDCYYINEARIDAPRCNKELNRIQIDW